MSLLRFWFERHWSLWGGRSADADEKDSTPARLQEAGERVFSSDVRFENTAGEIPFSQTRVYSGTLEDDQLASVDGIVTGDGTFDGHIQTRDQLFYIEPSNR